MIAKNLRNLKSHMISHNTDNDDFEITQEILSTNLQTFTTSHRMIIWKWTTDNKLLIERHTCKIRAKWHSAASSSPCFSAHISTRCSRRLSRWPVALVHRVELWAIRRLNSHWLMKWKSWENSCIVSAAFTLARSSSDIVHDNRLTTSSTRQIRKKHQHLNKRLTIHL